MYPQRPKTLESISLHHFLGWYERDRAGKDEEMKIPSLGYYLRKRIHTPYIVTHQIINPNQSAENQETYFHHLIKLFKPWRTESELLLPGLSYNETYLKEVEKYPEMAAYHARNVRIVSQDEELGDHVRKRAAEMTEVDGEEVKEDAESAFQGCAVNNIETAMHELKEANANATRQDKNNYENLADAYESLNVDQKRIVDRVVNHVCSKDSAIRLIVSGQGGTGKSRVIDVLNRLICSKDSSSTISAIVAAPTGLSAFNINGVTIHKALSLPVEHGKPADYSRLNADQLSTIRATLRGTKLLIVDEVSMVSSVTLLYIHLRLTEIMSNEALFGGISVVFFADLLQLPPVK